jgi:hypothetical protein
VGVAIGRCLELEADLPSIQSLSQNFRAHNTCSECSIPLLWEYLEGEMMFSLDNMKPVDLSPRLKARAYLVDGTLVEGNTDPNGKPWVMREGRFPGDKTSLIYSSGNCC